MYKEIIIMKYALRGVLLAIAMLSIALLFGCDDTFGNGGNGGGDVSRQIANVTGQVTNSDGIPIPGVNVITTDGARTWSTVTDDYGNYLLENVTAGQRVIGFYHEDWTAQYLALVLPGGALVTGDVTLDPYSDERGGLPVITIDDDPDVSESGLASFTGSIDWLDIEEAAVILNGQATSLFTAGGEFDVTVPLAPGPNTIYIWAVNGLGATLSEAIILNYTGDGAFRVTLTWNTPGDLDLHVWDPNQNHSYYSNKNISTGYLTIDDTTNTGPEDFFCTAPINGRFQVGVNYYSGSGNRTATIRVQVFSGQNAGIYTYGPYTFTDSNSNGGYPVTGNTSSWWRPCDVLINGSNINVVGASGTALSRGEALTRDAEKQ